MVIEIPSGIIKTSIIKAFHGNNANVSPICAISPAAELTVDNGSKVSIGRRFRARGCHIRVRKGAELRIGNNVSINHNDMIVCHEKIVASITNLMG